MHPNHHPASDAFPLLDGKKLVCKLGRSSINQSLCFQWSKILKPSYTWYATTTCSSANRAPPFSWHRSPCSHEASAPPEDPQQVSNKRWIFKYHQLLQPATVYQITSASISLVSSPVTFPCIPACRCENVNTHKWDFIAPFCQRCSHSCRQGHPGAGSAHCDNLWGMHLGLLVLRRASKSRSSSLELRCGANAWIANL